MPDLAWLARSLEKVCNTLHGRGNLAGGQRVAIDRDLLPAMLADIQGFGHADELETWAALAAAILIHRPYGTSQHDPFWLNYVAAHCAAARWPHPNDGRCNDCREHRRCVSRDRCIQRFFQNIKARDLRTQMRLIVTERPFDGWSIEQLQQVFFSQALEYLEKGRNYRKRPMFSRPPWIKRLFGK